jgi:hypothetical protein
MPLNYQQAGSTASITDFKIKFGPNVPVKIGQSIQLVDSSGAYIAGAIYQVIGLNTGQSDRFQTIADCKLVV